MKAEFVRACPSLADFPDTDLPEVAVAGRSNCGKSSLINALTGHGQLARSSSTPGRTQQIVLFRIDAPGLPPFHLADLPGYGYAKASHGERSRWGRLVDTYIDGRPQLRMLLLLNDLRREPTPQERDVLQWAEGRDLATLFVLTKADKLSKANRYGAIQRARRALDHPTPTQAVSVRDRPGLVELWDKIRHKLAQGDPSIS